MCAREDPVLAEAIGVADKRLFPICLGTAQYGSQVSQDESFALLDRFAERGGTCLDTAHVYGAWDADGVGGGAGNSEVVIGRWLRANGLRDSMVVGTKGGHPDFHTKASGMTREALSQHVKESLERLQTDYIDIYWLHRDDRSIPAAEILGWLQDAVAHGTIRSVGCSHWRTDRLEEAARAATAPGLPRVRSSQISWCLAEDSASTRTNAYGEQLSMNEAMWEWHRDNGMALAAYNSQGSGFFAAKYDGLDFTASDFPKPGLVRRYGGEPNYRRRRVARDIASSKGCTTNQIALAYLRHQPFPALPIVGPRTREQLDDSLGAADVQLSEDEVQSLRCAAPDTDC